MSRQQSSPLRCKNPHPYLPLDDQGTMIFFQLLSARSRRGSILVTSNRRYEDWGPIFAHSIIATTIPDRLLHHPTRINIRGASYRLKDRRKAGLVPAPEQERAVGSYSPSSDSVVE